MVKVSLFNVLRQGRGVLLHHPLPAAGLALTMSGLAGVNLIAATPALAGIAASPYFQFFYETNQLLALAVALYAAYKWDTSLGMGAILLFLALLAPSFSAQFLADFPGLLHLQLVTLITLFGIWLIGKLGQALKLMRQREQEISALAGLSAKVFNERVQLLEEASKGRGQLAQLLRAVSLSSPAGSPLEVARTLLRLVQEVVGAQYAKLTLVTADGTLGEEVDRCQGIEASTMGSHPAGLEIAVFKSWATQYIADTGADVRSNPALVASGIRSCLGLPVKVEKRLVGILVFYSTYPNAFHEEREFLESISGLLAGPLLRAELCLNTGNKVPETKKTSDAPAMVWR